MTVLGVSGILELALGMVLIYTMLSLLCSTVNEYVAQAFNLRSRKLETWIRSLLSNQSEGNTQANDKGNAFYNSPFIRSLSRPGKERRPSYIPARSFFLALLDTIAPADDNGRPTAIATTREMVDKVSGSNVLTHQAKTILIALIEDAQDDMAKARENVEQWFNDAMDRVSGWYRRQASIITVLVACAVVITLNADSISIFQRLWQAPDARAAYAAHARTVSASSINQAWNVPLPLGWKPGDTSSSILVWLTRLVGWLITVIAVSLGAPFWFDVLTKVANIRSAGVPPPKQTTQQ